MRRGGPRKHSLQKIDSALDLIQRGENPFRASKLAGIPRTSLLHHLEKMPNHAFPKGVNPLIEHIRQKTELLIWKARYRMARRMFVTSNKAEPKEVSVMWKVANESPMPALGTPQTERRTGELISDVDKVTFTKFVVERKHEVIPKPEVQEDLGDPSLDNFAERNVGLPATAEAAPEKE
jgi:hypothetical protein